MTAYLPYAKPSCCAACCRLLQVTEMKKVVQQKQVVVAQAKQDCEELLVEIVQDKRVANEQEKQVRRLRPCCQHSVNAVPSCTHTHHLHSTAHALTQRLCGHIYAAVCVSAGAC